MFLEQQGKCGICNKHQSELDRTLAVDHCHNTGRIRGLLCSNCNLGLGHFKDVIENIESAIRYLNEKQGPAGEVPAAAGQPAPAPAGA